MTTEEHETWAGDKRVADGIERFLNEPEELVTVRAVHLLAVLRALDAAPTRMRFESSLPAEPLTWRPGELAARVALYLVLHGTAGDPIEHEGRVSDDEVLG